MDEGKSLSTIEKILFLKTVDIFEHAAVEDLGRVAALADEVVFAEGETLYRKGEPVEAIYIVVNGLAVVENDATTVREVGEGGALGVLAALDLNPALRTVKAKKSVRALKLNVQDFQDVLSMDFDLVKAVFRFIARRMREGY